VPGSPADRRPFIGYPRGRIYAVADTPEVAERVRAAIRHLNPALEIGIRSGTGAADALDGTGARHGPVARLLRAVQFGLMDQLPDLAWYEAALREGRLVLDVPASGVDSARLIAETMAAGGAHFINHFGRFQTAEFARWRGPEPRVPGHLKR
jgi:hypothetical protein